MTKGSSCNQEEKTEAQFSDWENGLLDWLESSQSTESFSEDEIDEMFETIDIQTEGDELEGENGLFTDSLQKETSVEEST